MLAEDRKRRIVPVGCLIYPHWGMPAGYAGARFALAVHRHHLLVIDAAVPVLVGAVIVVGELLHGSTTVRPLPVVLGLAAAAVLWARRRAPIWTLAVSGGLVAVLFHTEPAAGSIAVLAPAVALYFLALRRSRVQQLLAAAAAVATVILADLLHKGRPTILQTLAHVLLVAIPLLGAEAIRTHRSYLSLLTERLELSERTREQEAQRRAEQERMRIARELHDVVAHTLTEINIQAAAAAERLGPGEPRATLEQIEDSSHGAIGELRAILGVLRDPDEPGAPRAPNPGIYDIAELIDRARHTGLEIEYQIIGAQPARLSDATSLAAYRIVQESLTNARRHAPGAPVRVNLIFNSAALSLAIENAAIVTANGNTTTPGIGIAGMLERATTLGGTLHAGPTPDGFRVQAELPYELSP